jgi:hypothetical protein
LGRNAKYNSGPALATSNPINSVVFKFVTDGAAAAQALANGDIDIYDGQPSASTYQQLKGMSGATTVVASTMTFEHVDLRVGVSNSLTAAQSAAAGATYNGPFAGTGAKATDLRKAFLLALPRQAIANKETVQNFDPGSAENGYPLTSVSRMPDLESIFTAGSQDQRTAEALTLVQKWYPNASATNSVLDIRMTFNGSQRRIDESALIAAEEAKAGFNVSRVPDAAWSSHLNYNDRDVAIFAWAAASPLPQDNYRQLFDDYSSSGANNHFGWNTPALDLPASGLQTNISSTEQVQNLVEIDKTLQDEALTLPLYSWPRVISYDSLLSGVTPLSDGASVVTNYWNWSFDPNQSPGIPVISGTTELGSQITSDVGAWSPGYSLRFQWLLDGIEIPGETFKSLQITSNFVGHQITLQITGINGNFSRVATSNSLTITDRVGGLGGAGSKEGAPAVTDLFILGHLNLGSNLTPAFLNSAPASDVLEIQWIRNGNLGIKTPVFENSFKIGLNDLGATLSFRLTDTKSDGSQFTFDSPTITIPTTIDSVPSSRCLVTGLDTSTWAKQTTQTPIVSGVAKFGNTISGVSGSWPAGTKLCSFWFEDGFAISGATTAKYKIQGADINHSIQYCVVGTDKQGNSLLRFSEPVVASNQTVATPTAPTISGLGIVGAKLTAKFKSFGSGFSYYSQWYRNGEPIPLASQLAYITTPEDVGALLSITISATRQYFDPVSTSAQTLAITPAVIPRQPKAKILANKVTTGAVLTGIAGNWPTNTSLSVQWFRDGQPINSANSVSYTIVSTDRGHTLSFQVTATAKGYLNAVQISLGRLIP